MADKKAPADATVLLSLVPADGSPIGNGALRKALSDRLGRAVAEDEYESLREVWLSQGLLAKGQGRGGSVRLTKAPAGDFTLATQELPEDDDTPARKGGKGKKSKPTGKSQDTGQILSYRHREKRKNNPEVGMVNPESDPDEGKTAWSYDPHLDPALQFDVGRGQVERVVDDALAAGDPEAMRAALKELKRLSQPYLNWTGKAERTSFEVDTVSLHVHERIDPASILSAVRKRKAKEKGEAESQADLFHAPFENLPLRDAIDFYKHEKGWANRLIAGDSLLVMNSLLQKEGMSGQVQMIYIDPPYGIKYGSNFQAFVNKRDVKDRKDEDLTQEPEMIKAFRDTWELGIHSYLAYLRDRVLLASELLHESGSVMVQISDENLHYVREIMDEVLGAGNFVANIVIQKTGGFPSSTLARVEDYVVWYAKDINCIKYHPLREFSAYPPTDDPYYRRLQLSDGSWRLMTPDEASDRTQIPTGARIFRHGPLTSDGPSSEPKPFPFHGYPYGCNANSHWKADPEDGLARVARSGHVFEMGRDVAFKLFWDFNPAKALTNIWADTQSGGFNDPKIYAVQTNTKVVERCLLMTTDPGDLVLDPTCGSGTTAYVAEKLGRRWITCDTSRVATTLAKQRLTTASYDYYELRYPHEGLRSGFIYDTVPHVTLRSIANNPDIDDIWNRMYPAIDEALGALNAGLQGSRVEFLVTDGGRKGTTIRFAGGATLEEWEVPFNLPPDWPAVTKPHFTAFWLARRAMQAKMDSAIANHAKQEILYDRPVVSKTKRRITGPFTVEAVPFPTVLSLNEGEQPREADAAIARSGESHRQHSWRDELLKTGIRGKGGQMLKFASLETLPDTRYLHCSGALSDSGERAVVSFGPEHAALEQRQVELALHEAEKLRPAPRYLIFCAFTFDPEAAKDIDETKWPGMTLLKVQMNTDLLTEDLKKAKSSNQSFWLMGQPDVEAHKNGDGKYIIEVHGFDYFDTVKGELVSGGKGKIAAWMLDTDYDERSLFPRQVFFPMAGAKDGWYKLKKDIRAELNEALLDKFHGTVSLPFESGDNRKAAVKIVDDRGIESLKIIPLD